ncbi:MAG TPA: hypothetical protein VM260_20290 [Pirellula sp.]|nr:hypothetical protein [Pirellula sp.]
MCIVFDVLLVVAGVGIADAGAVVATGAVAVARAVAGTGAASFDAGELVDATVGCFDWAKRVRVDAVMTDLDRPICSGSRIGHFFCTSCRECSNHLAAHARHVMQW